MGGDILVVLCWLRRKKERRKKCLPIGRLIFVSQQLSVWCRWVKDETIFTFRLYTFFCCRFFFHLWILEKKKSEPINIIYCSIFFRSELFKKEILLFLSFLIFLFVKKKNFFRKGRFFVCFSIYSISSSLSSFVTHFVETSKIQEALCYVHLDRLFLFASLNGESERKY